MASPSAAVGTAVGDARPLFLYLALQDVHEPLEVPSKYVAPYADTIHDGGRRTYAGMVSVVDECLANVSGALKAAAMWANSLLIVSNDNGGWMGYGGINAPYKGHKTTLWEGGVRGISLVVAPGRLASGARFGGLFHVTDWLPTLVAAAGSSAAALGPPFASLDGVDQWAALTSLTSLTAARGVAATAGATSAGGTVDAAGAGTAAARSASSGLASSSDPSWPRTELLHNIEGVDGTGVGVIRVGQYKLLHRMQSARGFDGWCDVCNRTEGCWMPPDSGPGASAPDGKVVPLGGQLCCYTAPPSDANSTSSCAPALTNHSLPLPEDVLYDIDADPSERFDLAPAMPEVVKQLRARLDFYNASNVPCCICTGSGRTGEMDLPPKDGYWSSFHDQTPNPDPNCKLQGAFGHRHSAGKSW